MQQRAFEDGYIDGWKWIKGNDQNPAIPPYRSSNGATPYRAGISAGVHDACASRTAQSLISNSDPARDLIDRFFEPKSISLPQERRRDTAKQKGNKNKV